MNGMDILEKIRQLSPTEKRNLDYQELVNVMQQMTVDEIISLSNIVGYPVFTRLCMGELKHKFVLLQDGAAAIIINDNNQILLQRRADKDIWGVPGGCQELGETFEETIIREIKEETNLDVKENDLMLIKIVSGMSRKNSYPNGDVVINNTVLYYVKSYSGQLQWDSESKEMQFFDLDSLPENIQDNDLIDIYRHSLEV